ncbi:hypothetical protein, conserved [Plasmodium gonderi]|uniref:Uncharacterized protein n=1 Tax=Plasmodium gonderi TaxID=77519 RepID=A0A1Y1JGL8_PLAGO|nr:hypothetical protein, conserved [Plasmodium gonderi]GAW81661.1 hypothetical protein, conserved [Plasmodium gonderi]
MDLIREYYSNCIHACTPEKYVIDQSEIEFSTAGKNSLRLNVIDWYYTTAGSFSTQENCTRNVAFNPNDNAYMSNLYRKRKSYTSFEGIKVMENLFLLSDREKSKETIKECSHKAKENKYHLYRDTNRSMRKERNILNQTESIYVENAFDLTLTTDINAPINETLSFKNTHKKRGHNKCSKRKKEKN